MDVVESFYRFAPARGRRFARLAQHVPDMLRYRLAARAADVVHFQWLPVQQLDGYLLPRQHPRLLTAHDVLPREPSPASSPAQRALYERMDGVVVHSEHGAARLRDELGLDPALVHVIRHGALTGLDVPGEAPFAVPDRPVVLMFGLLRPYKGVDVLLEAWRRGGRRRRAVGDRHAAHGRARRSTGPNVRTALRFVSAGELAGAFRAASLVVLPYREIDQSGVLFTALAFGKPMLLTRVGGFPEVAATGAAELVEPGRSRRAGGGALRAAGRSRAAGADGRGLPGGRGGRVRLGRHRPPHARPLRGAPGVDDVVRRRRRVHARRGPHLARLVEAALARDAARAAVVLVREQLEPRDAQLERRSACSCSTARVATPRPRASFATQ